MSTRKAVRQLMTTLLGGKTGNISSGTASTAVLLGIGRIGNHVGDLLVMPDAANVDDYERVVSAWDALDEQVSFEDVRADVTYPTSAPFETWELYPQLSDPFSLSQINEAINKTLRLTKHTAFVAIPTIEGKREYSLNSLDWLETLEDVDAVFLRYSPNLAGNGDLSLWGAGASAAPSLWPISGTGATIARATTWATRGGYNAALTRVGNDARLTHSVGMELARQLAAASRSVTMRADVHCATAAIARIGIDDGITVTWADDYHTGGGTIETLEVTKALAATATKLDLILSVDTTDGVGSFSDIQAEEGTEIRIALADEGDAGWRRRSVSYDEQVQSPVVRLELGSKTRRGMQLVIATRMPFPELSADSDVTDCPDSVVVPGAVFHLASEPREGVDNTIWLERAGINGAVYSDGAEALVNVNLEPTHEQAVVRGA